MITHHLPSPNLAPVILRGWHIATPAEAETAVHEVGPSCGVDLVFRVSQAGCRLVLLGMRTRKAHVELVGGAEYLGFRFRAGHVPAFAGQSFPELVDSCLDIQRLEGICLDELGAGILAHSEPRAKLALLEECVRRAGVIGHSSPCLAAAAAIEERGGMVMVKEAAALAGVHPRSLERFFRSHFTITPKQFIRIARLNAAALQLVGRHHESMAGVAQECGYADQAHMAREFKRMTDRTPRMINPEYTGRIEGDPPGEVHRYRK